MAGFARLSSDWTTICGSAAMWTNGAGLAGLGRIRFSTSAKMQAQRGRSRPDFSATPSGLWALSSDTLRRRHVGLLSSWASACNPVTTSRRCMRGWWPSDAGDPPEERAGHLGRSPRGACRATAAQASGVLRGRPPVGYILANALDAFWVAPVRRAVLLGVPTDV